MEMSKRQKYDIKKSLKEIEKYEGKGTELISLYVPPDKKISDVSSYLQEELSESSNIKSKSTRKHVQSALKSIKSKLKYFKEPPENGVVFFVGEVSKDGHQTEMVSEVVEPPRELETFRYRCDSTFYVEPLRKMIGEKNDYGLIVVDRSEATIGMLHGMKVETLKNIQSLIPSKHSKGGQSAQRFERAIENAAHKYFTKVGETANELLLNKDIEGLLVGGPGATKDKFAEGDYLHHELENDIISTFNTGYTDEYGLKELVDNAQETLSELEVMKEKELMDELMEEIKKKDGGLATYGVDEIERAIQIGAVDTLLISEGLEKESLEVNCEDCGFEDKITVERGKEEPDCPECGSTLNVEERRDYVDELYEKAEGVGSEVELISQESEKGELLLDAFGGLAAILRFRIS